MRTGDLEDIATAVDLVKKRQELELLEGVNKDTLKRILYRHPNETVRIVLNGKIVTLSMDGPTPKVHISECEGVYELPK